MSLFQDKYKTNSNRLQNWDYSNQAVYFITITTEDRKCIFGSVVDDKMILNNVGQIVENELLKSIKIRKDWFFHNWIVMPNHIHLLIEIQNENEIQKEIQKENQIQIQNQNEIVTTTHIVETHCSASTPGTSTKIEANVETNIETHVVSNVAETHCCASLHIQGVDKTVNKNTNQSQSKLSRKSNSISSFVAIFKSVTTKQINDLYKNRQIANINSKKIWQTNYHDHIVRNHKRFETIYNYIKANPRSWDTDSINSKFQ
ncbi:transposase [Flavobacterium sp. MMLR14_040]|uniref:transposase n=1 Tax=Flavobacterium sp. MMLR14_040 TaxID=3093843 RepID=UPI00298F755D|nr:transposase [Flavobacterium sp. MMLR14_040]MDW8848675.1 transposase [Flavobacterium sp. MMLR14_040]